ncbi:hypothetical protein [Methylobacterium brachiatum]|uniref:hypothetical protein n=1 Tax=Methylobacterium brachiatum TaxID=269660 RepID=UPI0033152892
MNNVQLNEWAEEFRRAVIYAWDEEGTPVIGGDSVETIAEKFEKLVKLDVDDLVYHDMSDGTPNCLVSQAVSGSACNQFFPTLLKTKDISATTLTGWSVYSYFAEPSLRPAFCKFVRGLLEDDSFRFISKVVKDSEQTGASWVQAFRANAQDGIWLKAVGAPKAGELSLSRADVERLLKLRVLNEEQVVGAGQMYRVHRYDPSRRLMDFRKAFRFITGGPPPTNFPPAVAKYLYLRFTKHLDENEVATVFDPSAGWGGRLLGALACQNERRIHYVGADPNSDHWMSDLGITKYEYLADFFNGNIRGKHRTTCEIFRCGSEMISADEDFEKYRGKIDFVFTSPPYFAAEGYSDEATQSHIKYPTYEDWRDGFLTDTLTTCAHWLKENRYLCLNIADVRFNDKVLPLQQDATDILLSLGLWPHPELKMVLQTAPGEPKDTEAGIPKIRNFCNVKGRRRKFEPILVFQKLLGHDDLY